MNHELATIVENLEDHLATEDWGAIEKNVRRVVKFATCDQIEELLRVLEIFDEYCRKSDYRKKYGLQDKGIFWDLPCQNLAGFILRQAINSDGEDSEMFKYIKSRISLVKAKSLCETPRRSKSFSDEIQVSLFEVVGASSYFLHNDYFIHYANALDLISRLGYLDERILNIPHDYSFSNHIILFNKLIERKEKNEKELEYIFDNEVMPEFEFLSDYDEELYNDTIEEKVQRLEEENEDLESLIYTAHLNLIFLSAEVGQFYRAGQMAVEFQGFYDLELESPETRKAIRLISDGEQDFRKIRRIIGNKFPYS